MSGAALRKHRWRLLTGGISGCFPGWRRLCFEPLEDRRLLSITVDTLVDENNGVGIGAGTSLREAIAAASGGESIDFAVAGTIQLAATHLTINKSLILNGPGADLLTIRAFDPTPTQKNGDGGRVFNIDNGNDGTLVDVNIVGFTLTGGDVAGDGGAISSHENVRVAASVISGNAAGDDGGAIYGYRGHLTIENTTISDNHVRSTGSDGGGINCNFTTGGNLTIRESTFRENSAVRRGGAFSTFRTNILIENSIITGNTVTGKNGNGGGIFCAFGTTNIVGTTIGQNATSGLYAHGGGIFDSSGTLSITSSVISGNCAPAYNNVGGGIFSSYSDVSIANTSVSGNSALRLGGGIYLNGSDLELTDSTISGNSSYGPLGDGGGIVGRGYIEIVRSTIHGNSATRNGGGIIVSQGSLRVEDSTVSNNSAGATGGGIVGGTGYQTPGITRIVNSTISGNTAGTRGGGVFGVERTYIESSTVTANAAPPGMGSGVASYGPPAFVRVRSSIIAGNTNSDLDFVGLEATNSFQSGGYNLIGSGNGTGAFNEPGDHTGVANPMLGPLADNGGPTETHAPGSPAINAGDPNAVAGVGDVPLHDQRGAPFTRVYDGRIDIGAFEIQPMPPAFFGDYNRDGTVDAADYVVWRKLLGSNVAKYSGADGSGDGTIDQGDFSVWRAHFGQTLPPLDMGFGASIVTTSIALVTPDTTVSSEKTSVGLHRSEPKQAVEVLGTNKGQPARAARIELVVPPAPQLAHYRPAIRSSLLATAAAAANRHDYALLAWLENASTNQKVKDWPEPHTWVDEEASSAGELQVDSVDEVFALLARD